jgi:L-methionine (R)-S-oxide reductase
MPSKRFLYDARSAFDGSCRLAFEVSRESWMSIGSGAFARRGHAGTSAALNIPPHVRDLIAQIPRGKGMAGLAWERDEPVATCNLKEDNLGNVRPGAKAVNAGSGVALPVRDRSQKIRAIVGIAYKDPRELSQDDLHILLSDAATLP